MQSLLRYSAAAVFVLASVCWVPAAAPLVTLDEAHVKVLLHKLDAESFQTRQKADDSLRALGKVALPLLRKEREETKSLEVRYRIDRIVNDLTIDERIPVLVRMLGHENAQFSDQAEYNLRQAGGSVVPLLKKALNPEMAQPTRKRIEKIIAELSTPSQ